MAPRCGNVNRRSRLGGDTNGTTVGKFMGASDAPLARGRMAPLGMNATRPEAEPLVLLQRWVMIDFIYDMMSTHLMW